MAGGTGVVRQWIHEVGGMAIPAIHGSMLALQLKFGQVVVEFVGIDVPE